MIEPKYCFSLLLFHLKILKLVCCCVAAPYIEPVMFDKDFIIVSFITHNVSSDTACGSDVYQAFS